MKCRIAIWAVVGFLVAVFWAIYFFPTAANIIANHPGIWSLACLSCPVLFASLHLGIGVPISWAVLANAATYALLGLAVETFRKQAHQTR
jgi:hypothetical protein